MGAKKKAKPDGKPVRRGRSRRDDVRWSGEWDRFARAARQGNRSAAKKSLHAMGSVAASDLACLLESAVTGNKEKMVALLLELGANPNYREASRNPALLHVAAAKGLPKLVKRLLGAGANPKDLDTGGTTALHDLAQGGAGSRARDRIEVLKLLIKAGCPLDACDSAGRTALYFAASTSTVKPFPAVLKANLQFLEALLKAGADPCAVNRGQFKKPKDAFLHLIEGARGLHQSAKYRVVWPEAVKLLCKYGKISESELPSLEPPAELKKKQAAERAAEARELRAVRQLLKTTVEALRAARGDTKKLTVAIDRYLEQGSALECSPMTLWDYFAISSPGLPEKAGYRGAEVQAVEKLFEKRSKRRFG